MFFYLFFTSFTIIFVNSVSINNIVYPLYKKIFFKESINQKEIKKLEKMIFNKIMDSKKSNHTDKSNFSKNKNTTNYSDYSKNEKDVIYLLRKSKDTLHSKSTSYNKRTIIGMLSIWLTTIMTTFPILYDIDEGPILFP